MRPTASPGWRRSAQRLCSLVLFSTISIIALVVALMPSVAQAQTPDSDSRQTAAELEQAEKATMLKAYVPDTFERVTTRVQNILLNPVTDWHPFFEPSYTGGGFAPGIGYLTHVSAYNTVDVRGSLSIKRYKLAEAQFVAPRLFHRRGELSLTGGWRDATEVAFYGLGGNTSSANRADFAFEQPFAGALLTLRPTRRLFTIGGGVDVARWSLKTPSGTAPSVDRVYTPTNLPGLGSTTTYVHSQATLGFDWRTAAGYARRGGFYGITAHDYTDNDSRFGFRRVDYQVIQHVPLFRESWVVSLRGLATTTWDKKGQDAAFYMLPSLGGGSNLRGYSSWRFRDRDSLLLQGEWRITANRFLDTAVFYDAGKVVPRVSDLDFSSLKHDYGFGARFHTPFFTVLRIDVARSSEGTSLVFATSPVF